MKAEEAFASGGFRRVFMPGIVLTIGLHPILSTWLPIITTTYSVEPTIFLIAEIIFFGLAISSGVQWIYYVYEGFRLSPLTGFGRWLNERRLARLEKSFSRYEKAANFDSLSDQEKNKCLRLNELLSDYPRKERPPTDSGQRYVDRPTLLGNIIATYELYPSTRYGIDGIVYWDHLLNLAPDLPRKHFDEQYAFAESLVLTSFAGASVVGIHILMLIGFWIGSVGPLVIRLHSGPRLSIMLAVLGALACLFFYRAALSAHRDAGAEFRAIVDSVVPTFTEWAKTVEAPVKPDTSAKLESLAVYLDTLYHENKKTRRKRSR